MVFQKTSGDQQWDWVTVVLVSVHKALISLKSVSIDRKKSRKYQYFNINSFTSQTLKLGNIAKIRLKLTTFDKALF